MKSTIIILALAGLAAAATAQTPPAQNRGDRAIANASSSGLPLARQSLSTQRPPAAVSNLDTGGRGKRVDTAMVCSAGRVRADGSIDCTTPAASARSQPRDLGN